MYTLNYQFIFSVSRTLFVFIYIFNNDLFISNRGKADKKVLICKAWACKTCHMVLLNIAFS